MQPADLEERTADIGGSPYAQNHCELTMAARLARLHLLGPIFAIFAGLVAGKPLYPMTRTVWNRL